MGDVRNNIFANYIVDIASSNTLSSHLKSLNEFSVVKLGILQKLNKY